MTATPLVAASSRVPGLVRIYGDPRFHTDNDVLALGFAVDGTLWSVEEPGVLRHWNASGQELDCRSLSDVATLWSLSPDCTLLVAASDDLSIWETKSGQLRTAVAQPSWVTTVAFRADHRCVATGHDDGIIRLWDVGNGRLLREFAGHPASVSAVAFSPDGKFVASAGEDKVIYLWDVASEKRQAELAGHSDRIGALAWHPDGRRLVSAGWDTSARVWDIEKADPLILLNVHAGQVTALAISPDGQRLATADAQDAIFLWDMATYRLRQRLEGHGGPIHCLAFQHDSQRLVSGGADRELRLWSVGADAGGGPMAQPSARSTSQGVHGPGLALACGRRRLAAVAANTLRIWDTDRGATLAERPQPKPLSGLAISADGHLVACGFEDGSVSVGDLSCNRWQNMAEGGQDAPVTVLAFAANASRLAAGSSQGWGVWVWKVDSGEPELLIPDALDGCSVEALAFHPNGRMLAAGGIDWLATGGSDGAVAFWDLDERCEVATFDGGVTCLAFDPLGRWLAAAGLSHSISIWDVESRSLAAECVGHEEKVAAVAFSPDGRWLASGAEDRNLCLWEAATGRQWIARELPTQIRALAFSPDGQFLFTGNGNQTCYQVRVADLLRSS